MSNYSQLLSTDDEDETPMTVSSQGTSLCLALSGTEDESDLSRTKRRRAMSDTDTQLNETGACGGPDDLFLASSRSRTSTPIRMCLSSRTSSPIFSRTTSPASRTSTPRPETPTVGTPNETTEASRNSNLSSERKNDSTELKKMMRKIQQIDENIKRYDERSQRIEKKLDEVLLVTREYLESKPKKHTKKTEVPAQIAQSIRDGYQQGMQEKDLCWTSKHRDGHQRKYNSVENKAMTDHILLFVKGQYPSEEEGVISEGLKTYFKSFKAKIRRVDSGKQEEHNRKMAIRSRISRKVHNRKKALKKKTTIEEKKREEIAKTLLMNYCSLEETDSENEGGFIVRPLPWRSDDYTSLVHKLDKKHEESLSKRSKRQCNIRKVGTPSTREKPAIIIKGHEWVFK